MRRFYIYLAALISIMSVPVSALAEIAADPVTPVTQSRHWSHTVNAEGFYIDFPSVNYTNLINKIRTSQAYFTLREQVITKYLEENQMNSKDAVITVIMPGGLLYAAIKKGNLEQAKSELAEITEVMDELSYDLLAMQTKVNTLTMAQLQ